MKSLPVRDNTKMKASGVDAREEVGIKKRVVTTSWVAANDDHMVEQSSEPRTQPQGDSV